MRVTPSNPNRLVQPRGHASHPDQHPGRPTPMPGDPELGGRLDLCFDGCETAPETPWTPCLTGFASSIEAIRVLTKHPRPGHPLPRKTHQAPTRRQRRLTPSRRRPVTGPRSLPGMRIGRDGRTGPSSPETFRTLPGSLWRSRTNGIGPDLAPATWGRSEDRAHAWSWRIVTNASAACIPACAPRHRAWCSTASIDRKCGKGDIWLS